MCEVIDDIVLVAVLDLVKDSECLEDEKEEDKSIVDAPNSSEVSSMIFFRGLCGDTVISWDILKKLQFSLNVMMKGFF